MLLPRRNAASALEDAASHLAAGMEAARRGRHSLPELRALERSILRTWAQKNNRLFREDPTLSLERRQLHGEHAVAYDTVSACWWKATHPGNFFQTPKGVLPIDGIITKISQPIEHQWLMDRIAPTD